MIDISIESQLNEVEITIMAREDMANRAINGNLKRPPEWIARVQQRTEIMRAVLVTLRNLKNEEKQ